LTGIHLGTITGLILLFHPASHTLDTFPSDLAPLQQATVESKELLEARTLNNLAVKLYNDRKFKEALDAAKRAVQIRETNLPADDKRVLEAMANLAAIYLALQKYEQAENYYQRALGFQEKRFGPDSVEVANTLEVLGWLHYARGDVKQSGAAYKRALTIKEKITGPKSEEVARALYRLAEIFQTQGALEEAEPFYWRLLEFDDKLMLEPDISVNDARQSFVCLLRKMNRSDEADKVLYRDKPKPPVTFGPGQTSSGILNGKALRLKKPDYPDQARLAGVAGAVVVTVTINENGKVVRACAVKGPPLLWLASERAAYDSEFAPTLLNGMPVKVTGVIVYNFVRQ
jgi:tetratricopeptide (TPR) repeat protein